MVINQMIGKNLKIFGIRQSLIGDSIMALPILNWLELKYPNSYKYWHIARKCAQSSQLYHNHPLIDKIVISDCEEGQGPKDLEIMKECDIVFNTTPQHPFEQGWQNYRNIYEETWIMAGIPLDEYHNLSKEQQKPKLYRWFNKNKLDKTICIHCFAGYGRDNHRSPSMRYWEYLIVNLIKSGYEVIRLGHTNEPLFYSDMEGDYVPCNPIGFKDLRHLSFIEQIKISLDCSLYIGSDSGFSLCVSSYDEIPQITLMCSWNKNHIQNPLALAPNGNKCVNLYHQTNCDQISHDSVTNAIKQLI